jgi:ketosteroid isomerase-like protein
VTETDVVTVRALYDAWNNEGPRACAARLHPEASWHDLPGLPDADSHQGRDAVERNLVSLIQTAGSFKITIEEVEEIHGEVAAHLWLHESVSPTGVPMDFRVVHVHRLRDGVVDPVRAYADREQALAAGP